MDMTASFNALKQIKMLDEVCVIFDLDGTLIESEPLWRKAFLEVTRDFLDDNGIRYRNTFPDDMTRFEGGRVPDTVNELLKWLELYEPLNAPEVDVLIKRVVAQVTSWFVERPTPNPEMVGLAKRLHAQRVPLAVATSSAPDFMRRVLDTLGLTDHFRVQESSFFLPIGKPHPQVYLNTLMKLGYPAEKAIAIEDSPTGVASALRAQIRTFWIRPSPMPPLRGDILSLQSKLPEGWTAGWIPHLRRVTTKEMTEELAFWF